MRMRQVKVSIVSYLNAQPMLYGLQRGAHCAQWDIALDIPSRCAERVIQKEVDIGLMPVAMLPYVADGRIVSRYCIGAEHSVGSVCLLSSLPVERIRTIHLDPESRTSANLCRILAREYWQITPRFESLNLEKVPLPLPPEEAILLIGDKALAYRSYYEYSYDLSQEWNNYSGLPFMFAAWVSAKSLSPGIIHAFDSDLTWGISHKADALKERQGPVPIAEREALNYLKNNISYLITESKKQALQSFLSLCESLPEPVACCELRIP